MNIKKIIIPFFLFFLFSLTGCTSKEQTKIVVDPFENIKITQHGWNGSGSITIEKGKITYKGEDETIKKLIKSISYKVDHNSNLSNDDKVKITLSYNNDYKELSNVKFKRKSYTYKMKDLQEDNRTIRNDEKIVVDEETGESSTVPTETLIVDDVEIPMDWNLSEDEIQEYVAYIKSMGNSEEVVSENDVTIKKDWTKGTSKKKTYRKNAEFKFVDYNNDSYECYQDAYDYGNTSSQKYKITPIMKDELTIGYKCTFKKAKGE